MATTNVQPDIIWWPSRSLVISQGHGVTKNNCDHILVPCLAELFGKYVNSWSLVHLSFRPFCRSVCSSSSLLMSVRPFFGVWGASGLGFVKWVGWCWWGLPLIGDTLYILWHYWQRILIWLQRSRAKTVFCHHNICRFHVSSYFFLCHLYHDPCVWTNLTWGK